jgi:hypothetical protein
MASFTAEPLPPPPTSSARSVALAAASGIIEVVEVAAGASLPSPFFLGGMGCAYPSGSMRVILLARPPRACRTRHPFSLHTVSQRPSAVSATRALRFTTWRRSWNVSPKLETCRSETWARTKGRDIETSRP